MRPRVFVGPALLLAIAFHVPLEADRLRLRSGKVIEGQFTGATSDAVRILSPDGTLNEVAIAELVSIEFTPRGRPAAPAGTPTTLPGVPPASPQAAPRPSTPGAADPFRTSVPVTVPAGTVVQVRLTHAIDVDTARAGMTFTARVDDPVALEGRIVIPRGATATLQAVTAPQSGAAKGSDRLALQLNRVDLGGRVYEVATAPVGLDKKGRIPAETTLRFQLNAAVTLQP